MRLLPMTEVDEFTIPRPRWLIPMAIVGAMLLTIVLFASFGSGDSEKPIIQRTGTTLVTNGGPGPTITLAR